MNPPKKPIKPSEVDKNVESQPAEKQLMFDQKQTSEIQKRLESIDVLLYTLEDSFVERLWLIETALQQINEELQQIKNKLE